MRLEIDVNGDKYPCYPTLGAIVRFHDETGKEINEIKGLSELCTYLWCSVVSASKREGRDFPLSLMEFADAVDINQLSAWKTEIDKAVKSVAEDDGEKKSPRQQRN